MKKIATSDRRERSSWGKSLMFSSVCAALLAAAALWGLMRGKSSPAPCGSYIECLNMGWRLREAGKLGESAAAFEATARLRPWDTTANVELANDYIAMGRYEAAKKCFAHVGKNGGDALHSYIREGYAGMIAGRDSEALTVFKKAVARNPLNSEPYLHLGAYMMHRGRVKEAEKYFRMALERSAHGSVSGISCASGAPLFNRLHIVGSLAGLLVGSRRFAEAEPLLRKGLDQATPRGCADLRSWLLLLLGDLDCARGELEAAEDFYQRASQACELPSDCKQSSRERPLVHSARCDAQNGRLAEARRLASKAESLAFPEEDATQNPNPTGSLADLAYLDLETGNLEGAERMFKRLIAYYRDAPHSPNLAAAVAGLAEVRRRQGRAQAPTRLRRIPKKLLRKIQAQGYW